MKYQINLLKQKDKDFTQRVIYFALHYLRYILVLTQIVVIAVFFYRFKIDQEVIDLKEELNQKKEIVAISQPLLSEAKQIDTSMKHIGEIIKRQTLSDKMLLYFLSTFPKQLKAQRLVLNQNSIILEVATRDPQIIKRYYDRLTTERIFKKITLSGVRKIDYNFYSQFSLSEFSDQNP